MTTPTLPFQTVLIANRGEIAIRLIQAVHNLHLTAVAVFVSEDATSPHIRQADHTVCLGSSPTLYNDVTALLIAAKSSNAQAVLPGYGFVSENPDAARAFEKNNIIWIGPRPETITLFGLKHTARQAAIQANVPTIPGSPLLDSHQQAADWAAKIGFPVLLKASAGGGGMGQAIARSPYDVRRAYHSVINQSESLFATTQIYIERYIEKARHIEIQVFGDGNGTCLSLGDRECSVQRRRQKVIEEACAPNIPFNVRTALRNAAANLCAKHAYRSAGTVEFILDDISNDWFFLEVNTRLQVEHGVTELVTGIDIVQWMLLAAGGIDVLEGGNVTWKESGSAMEARIYAENPVKGYVPSSGTLSQMTWPQPRMSPGESSKLRIDAWADRGTVVLPHFDPMLGKVLVWAKTRPQALLELKKALEEVVVAGVSTNLELLLQTIDRPEFLQGTYTTGLLDSFLPFSNSIEVVKPGLQSSLQDYPGRIGYWHIGVSPSGPMDAYAMGMANSLVGNPVTCTALEITVSGPTLIFHCEAVVAITGGKFLSEMDEGKPVPFWTPFRVRAGSVLSIGSSVGSEISDPYCAVGGKIAYLAVRGGFDAPKYLGSSSTFPTGKFGGLTGSFLSTGDFLPICHSSSANLDKYEADGLQFRWPLGQRLHNLLIPAYDRGDWIVAALSGPHASTEFLDEHSIHEIWNSPYTVHHATNRLGARLIGPTPKWTRADGGSAGLHPSNLHDYAYAPGAVNFSGNTPIVLMLDGPSLGGFVCPITVASADLWKVAQASPGERIRFYQVNFDQAKQSILGRETAWEAVRTNDMESVEELLSWWESLKGVGSRDQTAPAILASLDPEKGDEAEIKVVYRMSGDEHILVEYGEIELHLSYRLRVHMIMEELKPKSYVKELCPGVRSLLIRYDRGKIHVNELVSTLTALENGILGPIENVVVASRKIELPLAFKDRWTQEAQSRYLRSVRPNAPYMPSNVEFVRRINGLDSIEEVNEIMTNAEYMVLGLGDVYLGAPCAVPVDPRHRIVTSKYNPARTYTPEGAVGIGGAYMCIYGMDSPGGYQLCGRTLPIWDNYGFIPEACRGQPREVPWLLKFFDRVKFFPVSDAELEDLRTKFRKGEYAIKITDEQFSYQEYSKFCKENEESIQIFETKRQQAYAEERSRWEAEGEGESNAAAAHASGANGSNGHPSGDAEDSGEELPPFSVQVSAGMSATVWAIHVQEGEMVEQGKELFSLESMKVEIAVEAPATGKVERISISRGDVVTPDTSLCIIVSSHDAAMGDLRIEHLREIYKLNLINPRQLISATLKAATESSGIFELIFSQKDCAAQLDRLEGRNRSREYLPLFGVPFTVADDIDVRGYTTHVGFSDISYEAKVSAFVVDALENAGAVLIGKTRIDQLNVGYTGVEMIGAIPENPVYPDLIPGGNGSAAIAVHQQLASFAVVVDRHGKSTLAPALCGTIGMKTTEGLLPISHKIGSSIDCISFYGNSAHDIRRIFEICVAARQSSEAIARPLPAGKEDSLFASRHGIRVGICSQPHIGSGESGSMQDVSDLFRGAPFFEEEDDSWIDTYYSATETFKRQGYKLLEVDVSAFTAAAETCHRTPINYLKLDRFQEIAQTNGNRLISSISQRLLSASQLSASDLGRALTKLEECKRAADMAVWSRVDALILPLSNKLPTREEVSHNIRQATQALSWLPQLVTSMDMCSITMHMPPREGEKRPFGILVVAPAFSEEILLKIGSQW